MKILGDVSPSISQNKSVGPVITSISWPQGTTKGSLQKYSRQEDSRNFVYPEDVNHYHDRPFKDITPEKASAFSMYFRDRNFTGDLLQPIEHTIWDYEEWSMQLDLSEIMKTKLFLNIFSGVARIFSSTDSKTQFPTNSLIMWCLISTTLIHIDSRYSQSSRWSSQIIWPKRTKHVTNSQVWPS